MIDLDDFQMNTIDAMRQEFGERYASNRFVTDKAGGRTVEIIGSSFIADEPAIFGKPNQEYIDKEINWYLSMSRRVYDIENTPAIWEKVSDKNGDINSNYGWCVFSPENHTQFDSVLESLEQNPDSRQAIAIYTRPTMHTDAFSNGRHDFMCTNTVQYVIRGGKLYAIVNMRSNDVIFGYRNDYAWQLYVLEKLFGRLKQKYQHLEMGTIYWQTGSLHVYERDFYLLKHFMETGEYHITKNRYKELYGDIKA